ncbi:MAG TPA: DUF1289 domain-containing protein [Xanthobacteraceae bacterium]|jgi:predicted Fe-S protein YdhL (DUF1289 family)|nr:DUF1289 domain-containing protein [Xanthobacteraceae bacterium]
MASAATSIETPCNRVCVVHPALGLCIGCGRSLDEITRWVDLTPAERGRIMAQLPSRLAALSGPGPGTQKTASP